MSKTHHRSAIMAILIDRFYIRYSQDPLHHRALCGVFVTTQYERQWDEFWIKFNKKNYSYATTYLECIQYEQGPDVLWRLLIVEQFIEWLEYYY